MNPDYSRVLRHVKQAWDKSVYCMQKMNHRCVINPTQGDIVFRPDKTAPNDIVKLNITPVIFNVPERANRSTADIFIVAKGWLAFEGGDFKNTPYSTKNYGTEIAYFRSKVDVLEHIYGAHYDMDEEHAGHPVFHAQVASQSTQLEFLRKFSHFSSNYEDYMKKVLGTVRLPSAQMDFFSVMAQIAADHLIADRSAPEVKDAFLELCTAGDFFRGAAHRLAFLNGKPATDCYRSTHWYQSPIAK